MTKYLLGVFCALSLLACKSDDDASADRLSVSVNGSSRMQCRITDRTYGYFNEDNQWVSSAVIAQNSRFSLDFEIGNSVMNLEFHSGNSTFVPTDDFTSETHITDDIMEGSFSGTLENASGEEEIVDATFSIRKK